MSETIVFLFTMLVGFAILATVAFAIGYVLLLRQVTKRMQDTVAEMHSLLSRTLENERARRADASNVPPMRVHLEKSRRGIEVFGKWGRLAEDWLLEQGYSPAGQFVIEELGFEELRAFLDIGGRTIATIRLQPGAGEPYVEFCFQSTDGSRGGVSNPPGAIVSLPPGTLGRFFSERLRDGTDVLRRMAAEADRLISENEVVQFSVDEVPAFFEEGHAAEMDFLVEKGGISASEIRNALRNQGIEPSEIEVENIQGEWQSAIEAHLLDFSPKGQNHYQNGEDVLVVYDGSVVSFLVNRIQEHLEDVQPDILQPDELGNALAELRTMLQQFSPREALARFRPLLQQHLRYDMIDQMTFPVEADLYVLPNVNR